MYISEPTSHFSIFTREDRDTKELPIDEEKSSCHSTEIFDFSAPPDLSSRADDLAKRFFEKAKNDLCSENERSQTQNTFIEDSSFPKLPEKPFLDDSAPYILTTEIGQLDALAVLSNIPPNKGIYLGFSFEFNYHLLAERPAELALICDINAQMHSLYRFIASNIVICSSREEFLELFQVSLQNPIYSFAYQEKRLASEAINYFISQKYSWLYSDEKFSIIKNLYLQNKIQHLNLDLVEDSSFFSKIKRWADKMQLSFDIIYVSNIPEWFMRSNPLKVTKMKANLLKIISPQTIFIDAKQTEFETGSPVIRITQHISDAQSFPSFKTPHRKKRKMVVRNEQLSGLEYILSARTD